MPNYKGTNQHKPNHKLTLALACSLKLVHTVTHDLAPLKLIETHIRQMWEVRQSDKQILNELHKIIDMTQYGLGWVSSTTVKSLVFTTC